MTRHSAAKDGFYSSPRSWILEQGASFVNSGIGGHSFRNSHRSPWVIINRSNRSGEALPDLEGLSSAHGTVLHSHFASDLGIENFPPSEGIYQIAGLIGSTLEG